MSRWLKDGKVDQRDIKYFTERPANATKQSKPWQSIADHQRARERLRLRLRRTQISALKPPKTPTNTSLLKHHRTTHAWSAEETSTKNPSNARVTGIRNPQTSTRKPDPVTPVSEDRTTHPETRSNTLISRIFIAFTSNYTNGRPSASALAIDTLPLHDLSRDIVSCRRRTAYPSLSRGSTSIRRRRKQQQ